MLEIVRGCSCQDWLLLVPGNRPFPEPAKKNTNKNFKRTNFHISNFAFEELCNKLGRAEKYGHFSGTDTLNTKRRAVLICEMRKEF